MGFDQIQHVFVLMLENRSFDHLLGFSGISGTDAVTGSKTAVQGLAGTETNTYNGATYTVSFDYSRNPANAPDSVSALVTAGSGSDTVTAVDVGSR